jgi:hypothetical protein
MARALIAAVALVGTLAMAGPPPAAAQGGAGLYGPFPEPVRTARARDFFGDLIPTSVSAGALRHGVGPPAGRALATAGAGDLAASRRAGIGGDPDGGGAWIVGGAIAAAVGAGLVAMVLRRRPSEAH